MERSGKSTEITILTIYTIRDSIWLGYKKNVWTTTIRTSHHQLLRVELKNSGGYTLHVMVAYGENTPTKRREMWTKIKQLKQMIENHDWILGADFNGIRK